MRKYKVVPLASAYRDMYRILSYIRNTLANEIAAYSYARLFESAIRSLTYFPKSGALLNSWTNHGRSIRVIHIKKYVMFYIVDEAKLEVYILRVGHSSMNWDNLLEEFAW